jgi:DNA-binding NtrC family response regulator
MPARILVADDDPVQRRHLEGLCNRFGYLAEAAASGEAALARLSCRTPPVDLLILDLVMPDLDGMAILLRLKETGEKLPVIVETSQGAVESALSAIRAGANDFVVKPAGAERLFVAIKNALFAAGLQEELSYLARRPAHVLSFADLACQGGEMERVARLGERAAKSAIPVLIEGEPGTGKESFARAIHGASPRRGGPFVAVNCAGLPEDGAEAFLFGRGDAGAASKFAEAHGGTLFLESICRLPPGAQAKLLQALSHGTLLSASTKRPLKADVRLISATDSNLIELVKAGGFREDLFYRLNVFPIALPPLRARRSAIEPLARKFCATFAAGEGKRIRGICAQAEALLCAYDWPGNVRQLENAVFRAVVLAENDELTVAEFPQIAAKIKGFEIRVPPVPAAGGRLLRPEREIVRVEVRDPNALVLLDQHGDMRQLDDLEAEAIKFALAHYRGQMSAAARKLGIGRSTLYRKLKQHGLLEQQDLDGDCRRAARFAGA